VVFVWHSRATWFHLIGTGIFLLSLLLQLTALGEAVGTVSRGIPQADIDALPTQQYAELAAGCSAAEEQCPICR